MNIVPLLAKRTCDIRVPMSADESEADSTVMACSLPLMIHSSHLELGAKPESLRECRHRESGRESQITLVSGRKFGDRYIYGGLGTTVLLGANVIVKAEAGQPNRQAMDAEDLRSYRQAMMQGHLRALPGGNRRLAGAHQ